MKKSWSKTAPIIGLMILIVYSKHTIIFKKIISNVRFGGLLTNIRWMKKYSKP